MWCFPRDHFDLVLQSSHLVLPPSPFWIPCSAQRIFPLSLQDFKKCFYSSTGLCVLYMMHFSHSTPLCLLSSPPRFCSSFLQPHNSQPSSHVFFCVWATEFSCSFLREHGWQVISGQPISGHITEESHVSCLHHLRSAVFQEGAGVTSAALFHDEIVTDSNLCKPRVGNHSSCELMNEWSGCFVSRRCLLQSSSPSPLCLPFLSGCYGWFP